MNLNEISNFLIDNKDSFEKFNRKEVLLLAYICKSNKDRTEFQNNPEPFLSMSFESIVGKILDAKNFKPPEINGFLINFIINQIITLRWTKESRLIKEFGDYIHVGYNQTFNFLIKNDFRTLCNIKEFIDSICYYKIENLNEKNRTEKELPLIYNNGRNDIVWDGTHRILGYYFNYLYNNENEIEPEISFFYGRK
ncbi:MAG: hypothetical protein ACTSVV_06075 [Promethearchaeota archaeon]